MKTTTQLLITTSLILISIGLLCGNTWALESDIPVQTICLEAGNQGYAGMLGVAEVIRNRVNLNHVSVDEICLTPFQFSCWNTDLDSRIKLKSISAQTWQTAQRAWQTANIDQTDTVHGATSYLNPKDVKYLPRWARLGKKVAEIKDHVFYA